MYEEHLGDGYHDEIRKILGVQENLCPNRIIDADINIGGMKMIVAPAVEKMMVRGRSVNTKEKYDVLMTAARYCLAGILCLALKSRTGVAPYDKFKRNWDKKRAKCMDRANRLLIGLIQMG
jgi:hypothetical protein